MLTQDEPTEGSRDQKTGHPQGRGSGSSVAGLDGIITALLHGLSTAVGRIDAPANKRSTAIVSWVGVAVILLFWLPPILTLHYSFAGLKYWCLGDDAMISMRYAYNLAHGHGPVWNTGERVEGFTNPLLVGVMALFHLAPLSIRTIPIEVLLFNVLLIALSMPLMTLCIERLGGSVFGQVIAMLLFGCCGDLLYWTSYGLEQPMVILLFLAALAGSLGKSTSPWAVAAAAILPLTRADAILLSGMIAGIWIVRREPNLPLRIGLIILPSVLYEVFRLWFYHSAFPNTYYLKMTGWHLKARILQGGHYLRLFGRKYWRTLCLLAAGAIAARKTRVTGILSAGVVVFVTAVGWMGGDVYPGNRFLLPIFPLIYILIGISIVPLVQSAVRAIERVREEAGDRRYAVDIALVVAIIALLYPAANAVRDNATSVATTVAAIHPKSMLQPDQIDSIRVSAWLNEHAAAGDEVATFFAGCPLYLCEKVRGVDMLGYSDSHIARVHVVSGKMPGHNKWDFPYSFTHYHPVYVLAGFRPSDPVQAMKRDYGFNGALWLYPQFVRNYAPNIVYTAGDRVIYAYRPVMSETDRGVASIQR